MIRNRKKFIALTFEICRRKDLTPTDKLVLGRIASFDTYFESTASCAELIGVSEQTVLKAKQKLEKLGFIKCIENDGRGKKYVASDEWKTMPTGRKTPEVVEPEEKTPVSTFGSLRPSKDRPIRRVKSWDRWKEQNKELIPILDASTNYLSRHKIPLIDAQALRKSITAVANLYKSPNDKDAHVYILQTYLEYLESDEYKYQLEHTKYCPSITTQNDLFGKFQAIREFKHDDRRHYDPTKTLTR